MPKQSRKPDRIRACEFAAQVMAGHPDKSLVPLLWSLAVFFENYIDRGAARTRKDFGPKKPVKLKSMK